MIEDLRRAGISVRAVVLSEYDKNSVKDELNGTGTKLPLLDRDEPKNEELVAMILGVPILSHPEVSRGKARIVKDESPTRVGLH